MPHIRGGARTTAQTATNTHEETGMPFEITDATKLRLSSDLVFAIISGPHRINEKWTADTLRVELTRIGITFTDAELVDIAAELISRGDLVNVA